jgi:hypothetical protein
MFLARFLMLPIIWAYLAVMAVLMLIIGGLSWVITGETYSIRLTIGK